MTLRGLAEQIWSSLTSVDGKLIRTFLAVAKPGVLTVAYLEGQRKPYLGRVPLFLMANVLFFAAESLLHTGVFATLAEFTPMFDQALELHARSWIIVMALSFTPVPGLLFRRRQVGAPTAMPWWVDPIVSSTLLAACAAYLYAAVGAVYGSQGSRR